MHANARAIYVTTRGRQRTPENSGKDGTPVKYRGALTPGLARKAGYKKELRRIEEAREAAFAHALGLDPEAVARLDRVPRDVPLEEAEAVLAQLRQKLVEFEAAQAGPETAIGPRSQVCVDEALTWLRSKIARLTTMLAQD